MKLFAAAAACAFVFALAVPALAEKAAPAPKADTTIRLNVPPELSKGANEYTEAFKKLTPEQQKMLKDFDAEEMKATDFQLQVLQTAAAAKYCSAKDGAFAKNEGQYRAKFGVYNQGVQAQANARRQEVRNRRIAATKDFINQDLADKHSMFSAHMAINLYQGLQKAAGDKALEKTDCAAVAKRLDDAFAQYQSTAPAPGAPPSQLPTLDDLKARADRGDNEAMTVYGLMLVGGQGVPKDTQAGLALLKRAAESGYPRGQYMLGLVYGTSMLGKPDKPLAKEWLSKAAAQGDKKAQDMLKVIDNEPEPEALDVVLKKAEGGDATAAYELGTRYGLGVGGVERNDQESLKWKLAAAGRGHPLAQSDIGVVMLKSGRNAEAIDWITKAAEKGVVNSQVNLAQLYEQGAYVTKDHDKAVFWAKKAADAGDVRARGMLQQWGVK